MLVLRTFFQWIFNPILRIKKEEWPKTFLMSAYFFLTITSYYILKPVRDSVFIDRYGAENLPYAWLVTIAVLSLVTAIYVKFAGVLEKNVLLSSTVIFFVSNLIGFWWLSHYDYRWVTLVFFVWVSIFSVVTVTQFWLCANDLFNPRQARRLFGVVGSGGILGGITGGVITHHLANLIGTRSLLLIAALILLACVFLIQGIWALEKDQVSRSAGPKEGKAEREETKKVTSASEMMLMVQERRYLLLLVGLVCVAKIVSTLVDYQFKNIVQHEITGLDTRTAFFGQFFAWLNTVSFLVQFFVTSYILRNFRVGTALLLLPLGLFVGSFGILMEPALWVAIFTMIYDGSMNYSLNQSAKELLYLPIFREVRYRVKPFIDMVGYRLAKGIGSVLILFGVNFLHLSVQFLSVAALFLILFWLILVRKMKREYVNSLRQFLKRDLPDEYQKLVARSEPRLLYGLLRNCALSDDTDVSLAVRLYNLASDLSFRAFLKKELESGSRNVRNRLSDRVGFASETSLRKEVRTFLRKRSLKEGGAAIRFFGEFQRGRLDLLGPYLTSDDSSICIASACAVVLFSQDKRLVAIALKVLAGGQGWFDDDVARIAHKLSSASVEMVSQKENLLQILHWLSQDLIHQEERLSDIRGWIQKNGSILSLLRFLTTAEDLPSTYRRHLPLLMVACEDQEAVSLLYRLLQEEDSFVRDQAIHGLAHLRLRFSNHVFEKDTIEQEIEREIVDAFLVQRLMDLCGGDLDRRQDKYREDFFLLAQQRRFHETVTRIFLLLTLLAEPRDIQMIHRSLRHPDEHIKANALELLDSIIHQPKIKRAILQLVDADFAYSEGKGANLAWSFNKDSRKDESSVSLEDLFEKEDAWPFLSLVYLVLVHQLEHLYPRLYQSRSSPDAFRREMADFTCRKIQASRSNLALSG